MILVSIMTHKWINKVWTWWMHKRECMVVTIVLGTKTGSRLFLIQFIHSPLAVNVSSLWHMGCTVGVRQPCRDFILSAFFRAPTVEGFYSAFCLTHMQNARETSKAVLAQPLCSSTKWNFGSYNPTWLFSLVIRISAGQNTSVLTTEKMVYRSAASNDIPNNHRFLIDLLKLDLDYRELLHYTFFEQIIKQTLNC